MVKKLKIGYTVQGVTQIIEIEPLLYDLCFALSSALLEAEAGDGYSAVEKNTKWYAEEYKGPWGKGVGITRAKEIMKVNSLFYRLDVEEGYKFILNKLKTTKAGKRPKGSKGFDPAFIFEMAHNYATERAKANPKSEWGLLKASYKEKYPTKERREQRFAERSQVNAGTVRTLLGCMEAMGVELPKTAFKKGKD